VFSLLVAEVTAVDAVTLVFLATSVWDEGGAGFASVASTADARDALPVTAGADTAEEAGTDDEEAGAVEVTGRLLAREEDEDADEDVAAVGGALVAVLTRRLLLDEIEPLELEAFALPFAVEWSLLAFKKVPRGMAISWAVVHQSSPRSS
jgi:hypothetical protein